MRPVSRSFSLAAGFLVAVATGCGSTGGATKPGAADAGILGQFPADAFVSVVSASGNLHVEARTGPTQPPTLGNDSVLLTISTVSTGAPATGLTIASAIPYMTTMSMKAAVKPSVAPKGNGLYLLTNVDFSMEGGWVIPLTVVSGDGGSDTIELAMTVQR